VEDIIGQRNDEHTERHGKMKRKGILLQNKVHENEIQEKR